MADDEVYDSFVCELQGVVDRNARAHEKAVASIRGDDANRKRRGAVYYRKREHDSLVEGLNTANSVLAKILGLEPVAIESKYNP